MYFKKGILREAVKHIARERLNNGKLSEIARKILEEIVEDEE